MVRDEVMDVVQARAATGSSPMLVNALIKGKGRGKGKKGKGESLETRKAMMTKARVKVGRTEPRTAVPRVKTPNTVLRRNVFSATVLDSDCQQRAEDMRKATAAGRLFVDE